MTVNGFKKSEKCINKYLITAVRYSIIKYLKIKHIVYEHKEVLYKPTSGQFSLRMSLDSVVELFTSSLQ